jgi:hypothetical protein
MVVIEGVSSSIFWICLSLGSIVSFSYMVTTGKLLAMLVKGISESSYNLTPDMDGHLKAVWEPFSLKTLRISWSCNGLFDTRLSTNLEEIFCATRDIGTLPNHGAILLWFYLRFKRLRLAEAGIRKITVWSQLGQIVRETLSWKKIKTIIKQG